MRVNYAIVFVSDMTRSVIFYRDVLGLPLRFESPGWTEFATEGAPDFWGDASMILPICQQILRYKSWLGRTGADYTKTGLVLRTSGQVDLLNVPCFIPARAAILRPIRVVD